MVKNTDTTNKVVAKKSASTASDSTDEAVLTGASTDEVAGATSKSAAKKIAG